MNRSVLVVDDEPMARTMLRLMLVRAGFDVDEVKDGYEALAYIERALPGAIILDIMMPGIDGFAVCERLRSDPRTSDLPVIMLSARADATSIEKGLSVGATKYLTKPVSPADLTRHVRDVLAIKDS